MANINSLKSKEVSNSNLRLSASQSKPRATIRRLLPSSSEDEGSENSDSSSGSTSNSSSSTSSNSHSFQDGKSQDTSSTSSSSSSSSNSSSSTEDSEDDRPLGSQEPLSNSKIDIISNPLKKKSPPRKRLKLAASPNQNASVSPSKVHVDEEPASVMKMGSYSASRSEKDKLVAQLLCRWWYVLPPWPPKDFNYQEELRKRNLKQVPLDEWEEMEDFDENGLAKVYQISAFPGVFRDTSGNAIDLRPKEGSPTYTNLSRKSKEELLKLLKEAFVNQIQKLKNSCYDESANHKRLCTELRYVETQLSQLHK